MAKRLSTILLKQEFPMERLNHHLESFMGILFGNMKSPSQEYYMTFWPSTSYSDSIPIRLFTNSMTLIPRLTFTELQVVSMEHLQRVWHASRGRLPFRTPGSVPFVTCLCSNVETRFPELALLDFSPWIFLVTFSSLLAYHPRL